MLDKFASRYCPELFKNKAPSSPYPSSLLKDEPLLEALVSSGYFVSSGSSPNGTSSSVALLDSCTPVSVPPHGDYSCISEIWKKN